MRQTSIRVLTEAELETVLGWAAAEGWNPGLDDVRAFHAADPGGFLGLFVDDALVVSISVVAYDEAFGFLGFYICRPEFRGQGHGYRLWQAGLARLGARTVGLDGVVAQQANYARSGFALAHRNIRFVGKAGTAERVDPHIVSVGDVPFDAVAAYDRRHFPADRPAFMNLWLRPPHGAALAWIDDGAVRGYGVIRRCAEGWKIGPLFADGEVIAEGLFAALAAGAAGETVALDLPEPNRAALRLAERHGLQPGFETARMYRGTAPELPLGRIFGITTFELG